MELLNPHSLLRLNPVERDPNLPIEHQNVPAAHQGLHGFLYASDDEHSAAAAPIVLGCDGLDAMAVEE